jgi:putative ABC transport system permease protein
MIESRHAQQYPEGDRGWEVRVTPIGKDLAEAAGGTLSALTATLGLALLLVSANLAGLLLARSAARAKEIAVRATLGASRGRLMRQMLTESVLLSLLGGGLGIVFAQWGISVLGARAPAHMGLDSALRIDGTVLAFTLAVSVLTGIVFGLAPAAYGSKADLNAVLKGTAGSCNTLLRSRFLSGLVIVEIALAVVLLIGGGLLTKSFARLINVDTGVRTKQLLTFQLVLPRSKYNADPKQAEFFLALLERIRSLPGVRGAGAVDALPMSGQYSGSGFRIEGRPVPKRWQDMAAQYCAATPAYFSTMGIPVLLGREFGAMDRSGAPAVVIINQALARRFFPNENPIDRRINDARIIGVVGDVRHNGPARDPGPQIYSPLAQQPSSMAFVAIRTTVDPMKLAQAVRGEVHALDSELPVSRMKPMDDVVSEFLAEEQMIASILGGFGLFGLALAAIGIYGVIAYSVSQRTHEIGIRVALGATSGNVLALVLRKGARLVAAGLVIGIPVALAASRAIGSLLYGVSPRDVTVFVGTPVVLVVVALAATYLPARRAAKVDPLEALRSE